MCQVVFQTLYVCYSFKPLIFKEVSHLTEAQAQRDEMRKLAQDPRGRGWGRDRAQAGSYRA